MSETPSFQFYPRDFVSDPKVAPMSNAEVGIYIRLLSYAWMDKGLSVDLDDLAALVHEPRATFDKAWKRIGRCFAEHDGRLFQKRMEAVREEQASFRERQAENGKLGGRPRKNKPRPFENENPDESQNNPGLLKTKPTLNPDESQLEAKSKPNESQTKAKKSPADCSLHTAVVTETYVSEGDDPASGAAVLEKPEFPAHLPAELPSDIDNLIAVARAFLVTFANCTTLASQKTHGSAYTTALAMFRSRNATTAEAWSAFGDAWLSRSGKPLFGDLAKNAVAFLPNLSRRFPVLESAAARPAIGTIPDEDRDGAFLRRKVAP